tara:strand:+ start:4277 stop:4885 length:609 start_codon:yes stop_codon:yes gene_type:complete
MCKLTSRSTVFSVSCLISGLVAINLATLSSQSWAEPAKLFSDAAKYEKRMASELVLQIDVKLGEEEDMGLSADGHRYNYPITGGTFVGKGMRGTVVPGGADFALERRDGVTIIDALYRLKTDDGEIIIIHNKGIWNPTKLAVEKMAKSLPLKPEDVYYRTVPDFKTQPGKYDWLEDYIFVGTVDMADDGLSVLVSSYLLKGD